MKQAKRFMVEESAGRGGFGRQFWQRRVGHNKANRRCSHPICTTTFDGVQACANVVLMFGQINPFIRIGYSLILIALDAIADVEDDKPIAPVSHVHKAVFYLNVVQSPPTSNGSAHP
jgi:hypothetical protein